MPITLEKEDLPAIVSSLKRYLLEEENLELSDMRAKFLLEFILKEIGPFAYNCGVVDAQSMMRRSLEDLPNSVFEVGLTHWRRKR